MDAYIGQICLFGFNFAPKNWALCQGQIIAIASNTALFSLLGTQYGGNGTSTFALPNLQGMAAIGQGQGPGLSNYVIGETGGSASVTLTTSNMPPHTHSVTLSINANNRDAGDQASPENNFPADSGVNIYNPSATASKFMKPPTITLAAAGGSTPVSINDPLLVLNYSICLYGIFPARN